jgi:glutathione S-transferase
MRVWVLLTHFQVEFEEVRIPLFTADYQRTLARYSPSLKVPALVDGELTLWDSLAISEYISEKYLQGAALPKSLSTRAVCRAYCSEMHSGFFEIRNQLPMNCRQRRRLSIGAALKGEIDRMDVLWSEAFKGRVSDEDYLFGEFSIADSFFAPVASRFQTYGIALSAPAHAYTERLLKNPAVKAWIEGAISEPESLSDFERGDEISD